MLWWQGMHFNTKKTSWKSLNYDPPWGLMVKLSPTKWQNSRLGRWNAVQKIQVVAQMFLNIGVDIETMKKIHRHPWAFHVTLKAFAGPVGVRCKCPHVHKHLLNKKFKKAENIVDYPFGVLVLLIEKMSFLPKHQQAEKSMQWCHIPLSFDKRAII